MFFSPENCFQYIPTLPAGNLMEFGLYHCDIMRRLIKAGIEYGNPFCEVWGFDSFEGLPQEADHVWHNPDWNPGAFSVKSTYNLSSVDECISFCKERIYDYIDQKVPKLNFVPGFFETSLTLELGQNLINTVSFLHVDCDLYKSTIDCLRWVFTHRVLTEGCLVRFDDWLYNGQWAGNNRAFYEITQKFHIQWATIAENVYVFERMG